jgi:hypothetical protein
MGSIKYRLRAPFTHEARNPAILAQVGGDIAAAPYDKRQLGLQTGARFGPPTGASPLLWVIDVS